MHNEPHPLAGKTIIIRRGTIDPAQELVVGGAAYTIEDWWDKLSGRSWKHQKGNFASMHYAMRSVANGLPIDDEVVYGKIDTLGHLVHVSEISELHRGTEESSSE